ncbi:MAG: hypothetical protein N2Z21_05070 [Candidatus Sumerlaeaceae bacterium]|nr:hypothetical protein [Candidatus Sumerlaeaceae bacterium]
MKFVATPVAAENEDPRENITLKGITAEFTSGSLVQTRVLAREGVLCDKKGLLVLVAPKIEMRDTRTTLATETVATTATFYLADNRRERCAKGDFILAGNVRHQVPAKDDPTTPAVTVETSNLVWRAKSEVFEANSFYRMVLKTTANQPFVAVGDAFIASRDLRHWNVRHGGLATYLTNEDFRKKNQDLKKSLESEIPFSSGESEQIPSMAETREGVFPSNSSSPAGEDVATTSEHSRKMLHKIPSSGTLNVD